MTEINYLEILKLCFLGGKGGCSGCPFENEGFPKCLNIVYKGIEDTIKNQKAEIEELELEIDRQYEQAEADILGNLPPGGASCHWCVDKHKAYTIKEFAERLKKSSSTSIVVDGDREIPGTRIYSISEIKFDNLVKEMVGEG